VIFRVQWVQCKRWLFVFIGFNINLLHWTHWTRTITSYIEPTEHEQSPLTLNPLNTNNHLLHWSTEDKQSPFTLNPRNTNNHLLHWTHWTQITVMVNHQYQQHEQSPLTWPTEHKNTVMVSHQYQQHEQSPLTLNHWTRTITSYIELTEHEQSPLTLTHWTRKITSYWCWYWWLVITVFLCAVGGCQRWLVLLLRLVVDHHCNLCSVGSM
jgi:hypothetical protein